MENVEDFVMEDSKFASGKVIFRFILTGWVVVGGGLKRQKIAVLGGEHAPPPHTHIANGLISFCSDFCANPV